jgi:hypothetical protein
MRLIGTKRTLGAVPEKLGQFLNDRLGIGFLEPDQSDALAGHLVDVEDLDGAPGRRPLVRVGGKDDQVERVVRDQHSARRQNRGEQVLHLGRADIAKRQNFRAVPRHGGVRHHPASGGARFDAGEIGVVDSRKAVPSKQLVKHPQHLRAGQRP